MPRFGDEYRDREMRRFHDSLVSVQSNPLSGRNIRGPGPAVQTRRTRKENETDITTDEKEQKDNQAEV